MIVTRNHLPLQQTKAWKVLQYERGKWISPIQGTLVSNNRLKAKGRRHYATSYFTVEKKRLESGAIHCFRRKKDAQQHWLMERSLSFMNDREIFEVKGIGYVNHNGTEIAFKEIEFVDNINDWEI